MMNLPPNFGGVLIDASSLLCGKLAQSAMERADRCAGRITHTWLPVQFGKTAKNRQNDLLLQILVPCLVGMFCPRGIPSIPLIDAFPSTDTCPVLNGFVLKQMA
jgi:hypothetical protein